MAMITHHRVILLEPSLFGTKIRTENSLEEMLVDICTNSGEEIAFKCEAIAKKAADTWRRSKLEDMEQEKEEEENARKD